jgi:hypothetical protein
MSDHIHVDKGRPPWKPSEETVEVRVFHRFTIPLVGLIKQGERYFVYWCVVGHAGPESAWADARIDGPDDASDLAKSDGSTFDDNLRALVVDRVSSFAVVSDETGITEHVIIEPPADFDTAYSRGMQELDTKIGEIMAEVANIKEQYGSLRASRLSVAPSAVAR